MANKKNKVKFNIKNVHYALKTDTGYATPKQIPGAISISLEAQGELSAFYADGIKYYVSASNNGYEGDLEIALIPDEFRIDIFGEEKDDNSVLVENVNTESVEFALGFDIDGDVKTTRFWFYNCTATKSSTNEDKKEPTTDKLTVSCAPLADGKVRSKTTEETPEQTYKDWFNEVYTPVKATI